MLVFFTW